MMNQYKLARAALQIAQYMGTAREWDSDLFENIADSIRAAGGPDVRNDMNRPYWTHMNPDDTLDQIAAREELARSQADDDDEVVTLTPTLGIHIDASLASPEAIAAIFDGLRSIIRAEGGVSELTPPDPYKRSADS